MRQGSYRLQRILCGTPERPRWAVVVDDREIAFVFAANEREAAVVAAGVLKALRRPRVLARWQREGCVVRRA